MSLEGLGFLAFEHADLFECCNHHVRSIIDRKDNICNAGCCQTFDLMLYHRLVGKLNQRLRECEGLSIRIRFVSPSIACFPCHCA